MPKKGKVKPQRQQVPRVPSAHSHSAGPMNVPGVPNSSMNAMLGAPNSSLPNLKDLMKAKTEQQMGIKLPSNNVQPAGADPDGLEDADNAAAFLYGEDALLDGADNPAEFLYGGDIPPENEPVPQNPVPAPQNPGPAAQNPVPAPQNPAAQKNYVKYVSGENPHLINIPGKNFSSDAKMKAWIEKKAKKQIKVKEKVAKLKMKHKTAEAEAAENEMADELLPQSVFNSLTKKEKASVEAYTTEPKHKIPAEFNGNVDKWEKWSDSYMGMNNFLRFNAKAGFRPTDISIPEAYHGRIKKHINNTTSAIQKSVMQENRVMYRGVGRGGFMAALGLQKWPSTQEEANNLVGMSFTDAGFTSTSWDKSVARNFAEDGVVLTVIIPKGTQALYVSKMSKFAGERELLLQKGTEMRIKNATVRDNALKEMVVEVTRQNPDMLSEEPEGGNEVNHQGDAQQGGGPQGGGQQAGPQGGGQQGMFNDWVMMDHPAPGGNPAPAAPKPKKKGFFKKLFG